LCACGSSFRKISDVCGRSNDSFEYADGTFVHCETFSALERQAAIVEYQVQQTKQGAHILVHARRDFDQERLRMEIVPRLEAMGLKSAEVKIECVDVIPRTANGKVRRFVRLMRQQGAPASLRSLDQSPQTY